ncbi:phage GP46 family protein [Acetobacter orientalis]|uniref:phage GP46 family protein n=1 Tax=Acetobacter orientalis TaxID=146474 RepID=UPI00241C6EDF|nr:phage GP46 family protein [Acetobacter orientalis]
MDSPTTLMMRADGVGKLDLVVQPSGAGRGTLAVDTTLSTCALIALQSDRRAEADDTLPNALNLLPAQSEGLLARRGWIGDILINTRFGSRIWLLERGKYDETDRLLAAAYAEESMASIKAWWGVDLSSTVTLAGRNVLAITTNVGAVSVTRSVRAVQ